MTDTVITATQLGTTIVSAGTLTSITMTTPPKESGSYWFTLVDHDDNGNYLDTLFNMQTAQMFFPTGTVFPMYNHPYTNLVLASISPDSEFTITTNP